MFDKEFEFKGKHALMVQEMKGEGRFEYPVFNSYVEILMIAPIIGSLYKRLSEPETGNDKKTIFLQEILRRKDELVYTSQLVLFNYYQDLNVESKAKRVFNPTQEELKEDEYLIMKYILGGIEVLHEYLFADVEDFEDVVNNYYQFFSTLNAEQIKYEQIDLSLFDTIS